MGYLPGREQLDADLIGGARENKQRELALGLLVERVRQQRVLRARLESEHLKKETSGKCNRCVLTRTYAPTHTCTYTYTHARMYTHTHMRACTRIHQCTRKMTPNTQASTHTHIHATTLAHTRTSTKTHIHTQARTCTYQRLLGAVADAVGLVRILGVLALGRGHQAEAHLSRRGRSLGAAGADKVTQHLKKRNQQT